MEPWQSWLAAIVVAGGLYLYYKRDANVAAKVRRASQGVEQVPAPTIRKREDKKTSRKTAAVSNGVEKGKEAVTSAIDATSSAVSNAANQAQQKTQKAVKKTAPVKAEVAVSQLDEGNVDENEGDDEWAAQLDARKKGISLTAPTTANKSAKLKQPKSTSAQPTANPVGSSMAYIASLTGKATTSEETSHDTPTRAGGDVSDMLESRGPAPSVLRIVGEEKPKKQLAPKAEVAQETKKQRQNRRKVEEQRVVREQQENERQALLEKQRRTAREARGEPAKNGLAPSKTPTNSAWSAPSQSSATGAEGTSQSSGVELLDTFDHDNVSTSSSNGVVSNTTTPATATSTVSATEQDYPSEEAQIEQLQADSGWAEVSKPKKGKKKTQTQADDSDVNEIKTSDVLSTTKPSVITKPKPVPMPKVRGQPATNGFSALQEPIGYTAPTKGHPDDSDWL